jgi:hypothetical protein
MPSRMCFCTCSWSAHECLIASGPGEVDSAQCRRRACNRCAPGRWSIDCSPCGVWGGSRMTPNRHYLDTSIYDILSYCKCVLRRDCYRDVVLATRVHVTIDRTAPGRRYEWMLRSDIDPQLTFNHLYRGRRKPGSVVKVLMPRLNLSRLSLATPSATRQGPCFEFQ